MGEEDWGNNSSHSKIREAEEKLQHLLQLLHPGSVAAGHLDGVSDACVTILEWVGRLTQEHADHGGEVSCLQDSALCHVESGGKMMPQKQKI